MDSLYLLKLIKKALFSSFVYIELRCLEVSGPAASNWLGLGLGMHKHAVAATGLGCVQCGIGMAHEFVGGGLRLS